MRFFTSPLTALGATTLLTSCAWAIQLDVDDPSSVKSAAYEIAHSMMIWYTGNQTGQIPGLLPAPYYWWEAGALFGTLMDYWMYTGDSGFNEVVIQGMMFQASEGRDYMPPNQTKSEGNDDQAFWGMAAMTASEYKFPNPPADQPQWLELAQGVWNSQQLRWDKNYCGGGLRWQIFTWNNGYTYKNSPSNAGFINLGARLYAYTGNQTYLDWSIKTWDWMVDVGLIGNHQPENSGPGAYRIYDGTYITDNCSTVADLVQWSYSAGMLLNSAAVLWNVTGDSIWEDRANGIWASSDIFFRNQIVLEQACEPYNTCKTVDQLSFKAYFIRFLAASTKWMPQLTSQFMPYFQATAKAAASSCTGTVAGLYGNACSFKWAAEPGHAVGRWDGTYGFGQEMDALEAIQANLIQSAPHPVTFDEGITRGDPSAGTEGDNAVTQPISWGPITTASKAGAGILTAFLVLGWLAVVTWMLMPFGLKVGKLSI